MVIKSLSSLDACIAENHSNNPLRGVKFRVLVTHRITVHHLGRLVLLAWQPGGGLNATWFAKEGEQSLPPQDTPLRPRIRLELLMFLRNNTHRKLCESLQGRSGIVRDIDLYKGNRHLGGRPLSLCEKQQDDSKCPQSYPWRRRWFQPA